jgi:hypothetical protein
VPDFVVHPYGRRPIGVDQPPSSSDSYPLLVVPDALTGLLAGLRLAYRDDRCLFTLPFKIAYLYGFGTLEEPLIVLPDDPVHDYEIWIVDAENRLVFNSTSAGDIRIREVAGRLTHVTWLSVYGSCHLTVHSAWTQEDIDTGVAREYSRTMELENAILDPRTTVRMLPRVDSLTCALTTVAGRVELAEGFNVELSLNQNLGTYQDLVTDLYERVVADGLPKLSQKATRTPKQINIAAIAGAGRGRVSGCQDEAGTTIQTLNGIGPDSAGNLILQTVGTYRLGRAVGLIQDSPRTFDYYHPELTPDEAAGALVLKDDGRICCGCESYVFVQRGVVRQWERWKTMAQHSASIRDWHEDNLRRWDASRICRDSRALQVALVAERNGKVAGGVVFCNNTACCAVPTILRVTVLVYRDGQLTTELVGGDCDMSTIDDASLPGGRGYYRLAGEWPVYEARLDAIEPQATARLAFRFYLREFQTGRDVVQAVATVHYPDQVPTPDGPACPPRHAVPDSYTHELWQDSVCGLPLYDTRLLTISELTPLTSRATQRKVCNFAPSSQSS